MFPISQEVCFTRLVAQLANYKSRTFSLAREITVFLPESVLVSIFSDSAASSLSAEADVLDRVVKVVLEDKVFLDVDLHEGVAADYLWRLNGTEDSGPVIGAAAEESAVVLNFFVN